MIVIVIVMYHNTRRNLNEIVYPSPSVIHQNQDQILSVPHITSGPGLNKLSVAQSDSESNKSIRKRNRSESSDMEELVDLNGYASKGKVHLLLLIPDCLFPFFILIMILLLLIFFGKVIFSYFLLNTKIGFQKQ